MNPLEHYQTLSEKKRTASSLEFDNVIQEIYAKSSEHEHSISCTGEENSFDYRVQRHHKVHKGHVSMWHDITLYPNAESRSHNIVNMINEVYIKMIDIYLTNTVNHNSTTFILLDSSLFSKKV